MSYDKLVNRIASYIRMKTHGVHKAALEYEIEDKAFFMIKKVMFSVETGEPVADYIRYAVIDAIISLLSYCYMQNCPEERSLSIWKDNSKKINLIRDYNVISSCDCYIYDPQNIIKSSLQLLRNEYVIYAVCNDEFIDVLVKKLSQQVRKRKYAARCVVYIESYSMRSSKVYDSNKMRIIINMMRPEPAAQSIEHQDDPDSYIAKFGHSIALDCLTD